MNGYIPLGTGDVALAAIFVLANAGLSWALRLGIERQLLLSSCRMAVQLLMVGLLLRVIFSAGSALLTLAVALAMIVVAAFEIRARQSRRLAGAWSFGVGGTAMVAAGTAVTLFALTVSIKPEPWWEPRLALPLFGMVLGNTMTGISLGLDTLHTALHRECQAVEAQLLLGCTRLEALFPTLRQSLRSGFMPIINSMAATGVVSLPGMMTGQIVAGVDPSEAVKYQILIMLLLGGATGLGVLGAVLASAWRLTDGRHRLRLDRLQSQGR